jgi:hypothetical protein
MGSPRSNSAVRCTQPLSPIGPETTIEAGSRSFFGAGPTQDRHMSLWGYAAIQKATGECRVLRGTRVGGGGS